MCVFQIDVLFQFNVSIRYHRSLTLNVSSCDLSALMVSCHWLIVLPNHSALRSSPVPLDNIPGQSEARFWYSIAAAVYSCEPYCVCRNVDDFLTVDSMVSCLNQSESGWRCNYQRVYLPFNVR